jgi:small-conductance mechanosensitive channel/CRP-like cAMP-binding protein
MLAFSETFTNPSVLISALTVLIGVVGRHFLKWHPRWRLVGHTLLLVLITPLLLWAGVVPYASVPPNSSLFQGCLIGLAKVVWWVHVAWALVAVVRLFLVFERQPHEGQLLQDLVVALIYIGALLAIVAYVFQAPVGTLLATSGVLAVILGLALQSTLSDVFSGIALKLGGTYKVGDRITLPDATAGRVVETNWRATSLLNDFNSLVVLPNSVLAKAQIINLSHPEISHGAKLSIRLLPTHNPLAMAEVLQAALMSCGSIMNNPRPSCAVKSMDAVAVEFELSFRVENVSLSGSACSEIYDLVFRHTKAAGLGLAYPASAVQVLPEHDRGGQQPRPTPLRLLEAVPIFTALTDDEREELAATMKRRAFRKGDLLVEQDATLHELFVLRSGTASVVRTEFGGEIELGRLSPGDFFGERGLLTDSPELGTIRALSFVVAYTIDQEHLGALIRDRPAIADKLGDILQRRIEREQALFSHAPDVRPDPASSLVQRIRQLFHLIDAPLQ